jgi:hypothetical protein
MPQVTTASSLTAHHQVARTPQRIAPHRHRGRAGVVLAAAEHQVPASHPHDRRDHPDGGPGGLEHGPLLDVQLEVGVDVPGAHRGPGRRSGVPAHGPQRVDEPVPVAPAQPGELVGGEVAHECRRAEQVVVVALLVGEHHDLDRTAQRHPLLGQPAHDLQRGQ